MYVYIYMYRYDLKSYTAQMKSTTSYLNNERKGLFRISAIETAIIVYLICVHNTFIFLFLFY
jgi:hypothetical protein